MVRRVRTQHNLFRVTCARDVAAMCNCHSNCRSYVPFSNYSSQNHTESNSLLKILTLVCTDRLCVVLGEVSVDRHRHFQLHITETHCIEFLNHYIAQFNTVRKQNVIVRLQNRPGTVRVVSQQVEPMCDNCLHFL